MTGLALGIDVGTSGIRVAALDREARVVAMTACAMAEAGADRRAPETWRAALDTALSRLWSELDSGAVAAVAVDGTSGTLLGLDRAGAPVGGALMYDDAVDDPDIPARIARHAPRDSAAHGASSGLARALVLKARPGVVRLVHQADWIASLLTGTPMPGDESNALKTGYDPVAREWPGWMADLGLGALLPEVVPAGRISGACSGAFGLPAGAVTVAGVTDGCASFLATGAARPGEGVTALGTTLVLKLLSDKPVFAPEYGIYSHRIGDLWLAGGASNSGGGVLAEFFAPDQIAALSRRIDPATDSGLDYYPLSRPGERFPVADPAHAPRLAPRPADDAAFLKGLLEGIARIEALGYRRLAELGAPPLARLFTVGGGARNPVWTAMRARITGAELAEPASDAAAVGVARLALGALA